MPKDTGRTQRVRAALLELLSEKSDWTERTLRQACYGKLAENGADEKETQRLKDSIRRIVTQMQASGDLALSKRETTRKKGDATKRDAEETADAETPSTAPIPSPEQEQEPKMIPSEPDGKPTVDPALQGKTPVKDAPGKAPEGTKREERSGVKMPKAKQMNEFLSTVLKEDVPEKEETLVQLAVAHFGVSGEQVNGVRGLVIQRLMEQKTNGSVLFEKSVGYRKAPPAEKAEEAPAPKPDEPKESEAKPATPQVTAKRVGRPAKTETRVQRKSEEPKRGISRLVLNENRFAERINAAGGAFFTEFVARLFEAYYRSHGLTVCGRYVVDGSDDKGVDVILQTVDELGLGDVVLLQAKTRSSGQVSLKELREFYGVMAAEKADHGLFVTTSTFTTDAVSFVRSHPDLAAVDKYKLFALASRLGIGLVEGEGGTLSVDPALFG